MILNEAEVRARLRGAIEEAGSQRAYARLIGLSDVNLSLVMRGRLPPGRALLAALGLRRTPLTYEELPRRTRQRGRRPEARGSEASCASQGTAAIGAAVNDAEGRREGAS